MGAWWEQRMAALDLETTAADPEEARIVTAALVVCGGGEETVTRSWLADPGVEIPDEAAAIHGVTTERAKEEGRPIRDVVSEVFEALIALADKRMPLVIFNARYDLTVMDRELRRYVTAAGLEPYAFYVVDPFVIDKHLDRYRRGSRKLEAMCITYGASLDGAHDAGHDALAAARLAYKLGQRGKVNRRARTLEEQQERAALAAEWEAVRGDLGLLHEAQVEWARDQAYGLAEYFRSVGKVDEAAGVRGEWPLIPVATNGEVG